MMNPAEEEKQSGMGLSLTGIIARLFVYQVNRFMHCSLMYAAKLLT